MTWKWHPDELTRLGLLLAERELCGPEVTAHPVGDGHSNLTFVVSDGRRHVVARRPPPPPVPRGAHDVLRESRLVHALRDTGVPVPRVLAVIDEGVLLDVPLVITEFIDGVVITEGTPKGLSTSTFRGEFARSAVDTLADLHRIDWRACGLEDFGRPEGFNGRHLKRVCALVADRDGGLPAQFSELSRWLAARTPPESGASLVHNDFRIGNLMAARDSPGRVLAVLDWELATIGDPLFDLGYFLASYPQRGEALTPTARMGAAVLEDGYPSRDELLARYCDRTGTQAARVNWYATLAQFKLAALYEYGRRRADAPGGDPYFADPALVTSFLHAAEAMAQ